MRAIILAVSTLYDEDYGFKYVPENALSFETAKSATPNVGSCSPDLACQVFDLKPGSSKWCDPDLAYVTNMMGHTP
jgi:hypothetical protein